MSDHALFQIIFTLKDFFQLVFELGKLNIHKESKGADIHAADGNVLFVDTAANAQQRAVSADGNRHIHRLLFDMLDAVPLAMEKRRAVRRQHQPHIFVRKEPNDARKYLSRIRFFDIRKNRDISHYRSSFPFPFSFSWASATTSAIRGSVTFSAPSPVWSKCNKYSIFPSGPLIGENVSPAGKNPISRL